MCTTTPTPWMREWHHPHTHATWQCVTTLQCAMCALLCYHPFLSEVCGANCVHCEGIAHGNVLPTNVTVFPQQKCGFTLVVHEWYICVYVKFGITIMLAHMLDSLVRVSRRDTCNHTIAGTNGMHNAFALVRSVWCNHSLWNNAQICLHPP